MSNSTKEAFNSDFGRELAELYDKVAMREIKEGFKRHAALMQHYIEQGQYPYLERKDIELFAKGAAALERMGF